MAQPENYPMSPVSNGSHDPEAQAGLPPVTSQPAGYPQGAYPGYPGANYPGAGYPVLAPLPPGHAPQYGPPPGYPQPLPGQDPSFPGYPQPPFGQPQIMFAPPPALYPDPSLPPGLEYLNMVDQLIVKQKVELLEILTGFETNNKYVVSNSMGQQVYYAVEESDFCSRNCLGPARAFDMIILDNHRMEIMRVHRPFRCSSCCYPCCLQEMQVTSSNGQVLGSIEQNWSLCIPKFTVKNAAGETILHIRGPFCTSSCCGSDVEFDVLSLNKEHKIGKIAKKWSGMLREMYTDADTFGVTFPVDLDVNAKATLLAATFLIDFMFFEQSQK